MPGSEDRLHQEIISMLEALRGGTGARYACVVERKGVLLESADPEEAAWAIRQFLNERLLALFAVPKALAEDRPFDDVFADWATPAGREEDEFLLAFVNGKVAVVLICPDAEAHRDSLRKPMQAMADRLFRLNAGFGLDEKGRGLFLGRARLDLVAIGRPAD
jgi:hypothetical protein